MALKAVSSRRDNSVSTTDGDVKEDEEDEADLGPPPPIFPLRVISKLDGMVLGANTRKPVAFETDLFVGKMLMKLRTDPLDPFYSPYFNGKRRTLEFQVQGKFKKPNRGIMYMGMELPGPMKLGFIARNMTKIMLNLLNALTEGAHSYLGDKENKEFPHMVFPLVLSADRFAETKAGETPPAIGVDMLPEEFGKKGRKFPGNYSFNTEDTYTLSFHSMYLDMVSWMVVNLPGLSDKPLSSFFDDMPLHLVAYEILPEGLAPDGLPDPNTRHLVGTKNYLFNFEVTHTGGELEWPSELPAAAGDAGRGGRSKRDRGRSPTVCSAINVTDAEVEEESGALTQAARDIRVYASVERLQRGLDRRNAVQYIVGLTFGGGLTEDEALMGGGGAIGGGGGGGGSGQASNTLGIPSSSSGYNLMDDGAASVASGRSGGASSSASETNTIGTYTSQAHMPAIGWSVLRTGSDFRKLDSLHREIWEFSHPDQQRPPFSAHVAAVAAAGGDASAQELAAASEAAAEAAQEEAAPELRCVTCMSNEHDLNVDDFDNMVHFMHTTTEQDNSQILALFLKWAPKPGVLPFLGGSRADADIKVDTKTFGAVLVEGVVARALTPAHWREEYAVLHAEKLLLYAPRTDKPHTVIKLKEVISMRDVLTQRSPFPSCAFFEIEMVSQVIRLCTANASARARWTYSMREYVRTRTRSPSKEKKREKRAHRHKARPKEAFVLREHKWTPPTRVILNSRRVFVGESQVDAVALSQQLVHGAVSLNHGCSRDRFIAFMDRCSELKAVDLALLALDHNRLLAFFLNVYHALLLHALAVLGAPSSVAARPAFYKNTCYEIADEVFSLAEIEFCVLRGAMIEPELAGTFAFMLPHFGPQDRRNLYTLKRPDIRVVFALCSGSHSCPKAIPCFSEKYVQTELNHVCSTFLEDTVKVDESKGAITLPKVCEWYKDDFRESCLVEDEDAEDSKGNDADGILRVILRFLSRRKWASVSRLMAGDAPPLSKFGEYDWGFRSEFKLLNMEGSVDEATAGAVDKP